MQTEMEQIAEITQTLSSVPDPLHDVTDPAKRDALIEAMAEHGWVGAPIVVLSEVQALTGAHRIPAAVKAGVDIPRVTVEDLCAACGLGWESVRAEHGGPCGDDWYTAAAALRGMLPRELVDYLGYDVDGEE